MPEGTENHRPPRPSPKPACPRPWCAALPDWPRHPPRSGSRRRRTPGRARRLGRQDRQPGGVLHPRGSPGWPRALAGSGPWACAAPGAGHPRSPRPSNLTRCLQPGVTTIFLWCTPVGWSAPPRKPASSSSLVVACRWTPRGPDVARSRHFSADAVGSRHRQGRPQPSRLPLPVSPASLARHPSGGRGPVLGHLDNGVDPSSARPRSSLTAKDSPRRRLTPTCSRRPASRSKGLVHQAQRRAHGRDPCSQFVPSIRPASFKKLRRRHPVS